MGSGVITSLIVEGMAQTAGILVGHTGQFQHNVILAKIAKASFTAADLNQNLGAVIDELERAKPASSKGRYLRKIVLSSTMGPGVKVDPSTLSA